MTVVSAGSIALFPSLTSAASRSLINTAPPSTRSTFERIGGPVSIDRRRTNRNVSKEAGPQNETAVAVNPTNPDDVLAASNDVAGSDSRPLYEATDRGRHWLNGGIVIGVPCYDPWLDFNAVGDAFF